MSEGRHFQSPRENVEKKALQKGAKAAANAIGGPLAGKAVDLVSKSKLGNAALNGGIQRVHRLNPGMVRPQTLNNSTNNSDETEDRINPSTDGSAAIDLPKLNPLGRTGGMFSLDSNARKDAKKSLWKRIPLALRLKIIAGVAAVFLIFLIIMLIISMANPFNFLDMSGDSVANSTGGDFYNELNNYWSTLCEDGDKNCDANEIEKAKKIRESQQDFLKRFDEVTTGLNEEQKRALMTTIFMEYSVDSFYTNGEIGAFVVDRSCDDPENCAEETEDGTKIYREANDTLKKLVKEFGSPVKTDTFYEYLKTSDFLDKREVLSEYYEKYASKNGLDVSRKTSWNDSDKQAVREEIIKKIKDTVAAYMGPSKKSVAYITPSSNNMYWWPIGSENITTSGGVQFAAQEPQFTIINSPFGYRDFDSDFHGGVDLHGVENSTYVIASKSGTVNIVNNNCISGGDKNCGDSYGNFVKLLHTDGTYTLYAHMHQNSITVKEGDTVSQGQIIGKVGNSGNSYGAHLHFEVRTDASTRVDPLEYISSDNPRPVSTYNGDSLIAEFVAFFEGGFNSDGSCNITCEDWDAGGPTACYGLTLSGHAKDFNKYGLNMYSNYGNQEDYYGYCGTSISKEIADKVYADVFYNKYVSPTQQFVASSGLKLESYQVDVLSSFFYNSGEYNDFTSYYQKYGSSQELCNEWLYPYVHSGGACLDGLVARRHAECDIFLTGDEKKVFDNFKQNKYAVYDCSNAYAFGLVK